MEPAFSLLDDPWLPARLADGRVVTLGLLETFDRSGEIVALAETAPPSLVAQYRLLLAVLHRALTQHSGRWRDADRARWYREGLPLEAVRAYLESQRDRFWLFHAEHPFMQVAVLDEAEETCDKQKPWTQISLGSANGNTPVVFDHAYDAHPSAITPAQAVRTLLGFLQFAPGGLIKTSLRVSDNAGALANTAAAIPVGSNLGQTLALCLHRYSDSRTSDLPSWERDPLTFDQLSGKAVPSAGPNDRYTRQSRAVLLLREDNGNTRWLRFEAGYRVQADGAADPMASYRNGKNGPERIKFDQGRAIWRDLPAMLPGPRVKGDESRSAGVVEYAAALHEVDNFDAVYQPVVVAGVACDPGRQAKLLRWRLEQFVLPANLLKEAQCAEYLHTLVADAEALFVALRRLATDMLIQTLPDPASKDTRKRAQVLLAAGPFAATYFAAAERALPDVMMCLGGRDFDQADSRWRHALRRGAEQAWDRLITGLGSTPRALRAEAQFYPRFRAVLNDKAARDSGAAPKEAAHDTA